MIVKTHGIEERRSFIESVGIVTSTCSTRSILVGSIEATMMGSGRGTKRKKEKLK
jgi:hypothetical protein